LDRKRAERWRVQELEQPRPAQAGVLALVAFELEDDVLA
jgi:hypothetical protein